MEAKNYKRGLDSGKVIGIIFLVIFSLMFIFSCMKSVLPIGAIIVGTFGVMTFPLLLALILFSLAKILGLSYTRNKKTTAYGLVILFSLIFTIHSIATFRELNLVVSFKSLKTYLELSYNKITLVGSAGSVFCGLLSMILGAMGVIIICVIIATLFIGIYVDYNFYGKYESKNVRKIKDKRVRERVNSSDKNKTEDNSPEWSFAETGYKESDVIDTVTMTENETSFTENNNVQYAQTDVIGEITDEPYAYSEPQFAENQQNNGFSSGFYTDDTLPDVYTSDRYEESKKFLSDTFGVSQITNPSEPYNTNSDTYENIEPIDTTFNEELNGLSNSGIDISNGTNGDTFGGNPFDDISNILGQDDDSNISTNDTSTSMLDDIFGGLNTGFVDEPKAPEINSNPFGGIDAPGLDATTALAGSSLANTNEPAYRPQPVQTPPPYLAPVVNPQPVAPQPLVQPTMQQPTMVVHPKPIPQAPIGGGNMGMRGIRYNPPPLNLLRPPKPDTGDYTEEQNRKSAQLEQVLEAFNIPAKVKNIVRGPKITRYELAVPLGVSVKKIPTYENDIAAALAAKTITIRAPIPGSPYVGIELENDTFTSVYERELLESYEFLNAKDPLPIAIGKDISGEIVVRSLAKMVHLLIAGSTGSGKSVFIHNIVLSLIYKYGPEDLRLIMIDPKKVEFNRYNGLPHLLTPEVVMGAEKAINALKWCVGEMDRRYDMMNKAGFNNIEPYNKSDLVKAGQFEHMPYIVIIVDELAEIMLANKKESEVCIQRITQLARACGMHLILATQRPSVDIISGVIKNNIPSRIAFSLQSGIDSKTIIGTVGAEKLLGQGDMLFNPTGTSSMPRLQAAYASDDEIKSVIEYDINYNQQIFDESIEKSFNAEQTMNDEVGGFGDSSGPKDALDGYFKKALKIVMMNGGASTSYLQRRLAIGYSRAAKIIDQMEERGYIAHASGSKQRQVLITPEQFKEDFGEDFDSLND